MFFKLFQNWVENKCKVKLSSRSWKIFLNFITKAKVHLLLRIVNLNLQIIVNDPSELDKEEEEDEDIENTKADIEADYVIENEYEGLNPEKIKNKQISSASAGEDLDFDISNIKTEKMDLDQSQNVNLDSSSNISHITLDFLNECIENVIIFLLIKKIVKMIFRA